MNTRALLMSAALLMGAAGAAHAQEPPLKIIMIDVEGGTATLMVTPQGRSVLLDAGWPPGRGVARAPAPAAGAAAPPAGPPPPSNTERIVAAAKSLGLSKIDYMVTTHYHVDHIGGVLDLASNFPIGTYVDHGMNRELLSDQAKSMGPNSPIALYDTYIKAIAGKPHRVMKPGDTLKLGDLTLTALTSDNQHIKVLPGAGKPGVGCTDARPAVFNDEIENQHALGLLATYGKARVLALSDQIWDTENALVCPIDRIGPVDLAFVDNHGTDTSSNPALFATLKPAVAVMANGSTKGGGTETLKILHTFPNMDVWQVHYSTRNGELNYPANQIANIGAGPNDNAPLHINVLKSGAITVINARTGYSKTYPKAVR
jgi:beta-lactamase superfamily II metal-dependent hydrolase